MPGCQRRAWYWHSAAQRHPWLPTSQLPHSGPRHRLTHAVPLRALRVSYNQLLPPAVASLSLKAPDAPDCAPPPGCPSPDASEGKRPSESPRRRVESSDSPRPQLVPGRQPLAMSRSTVRHHPLVAEDSPLPGPSPAESPLGGSPLRGMSPDRLLNDLDMRSFRAPDDPSLNLLEVPSTNWTRSPRESGSSSLASSTCDLNAPIYDPDRNSKMVSLPPRPPPAGKKN